MPPRTFAAHDPYAAHRCACRHIVYRDDVPGGSCRFCECTSHAPAAQARQLHDSSDESLPHEPAPPDPRHEVAGADL